MNVGLKRIAIIIISVLLQIALVNLVFYVFPEIEKITNLAITIVSLFVLLFVATENISPDYKITWMVFIAFAPIIGTIVFFVARRNKFAKNSLHMQANSDFINSLKDDYSKTVRLNTSTKKQLHYLENFAHGKIYENNDTTYYALGEDMWQDMLFELEKAEQFIFMEYFIVQEGEMLNPILDILKKKAQAGLDVRFSYDSFGSLFTAPANLAKELSKYGVKCYPYNSKLRIFDSGFNNRDHRKITIIDGKVGFTGGINLADEYINKVEHYGHWKDTGIRIKGSAVNALTIMFLTLWGICEERLPDYQEFINPQPIKYPSNDNSFIAPYTDYPGDGENVGETMYQKMVSSADDYLYITSPYLILDYNMLNEMKLAAKSGVDIRIIVPGIPDKKTVFLLTRSFYEPLLAAGVRIFEYTPGFIHSKQFVMDDQQAIIGTINLDYRSLTHHLENAIWLVNDHAVLDIKEDFLKTQALCHEVKAGEKKASKIAELFLLPLLRIFAPMF